jgi:hypothetical protein
VACEERTAATSRPVDPVKIYLRHPVDPRAGWVSAPDRPVSMESDGGPRTSMVSSVSTSERRVRATAVPLVTE